MKIGITGLPKSGKSEALKILKKKGFSVIDADKIVHTIYKSGNIGAKKIVEYFGRSFITKEGSVNRTKLRNFLFNNPHKIKVLNKIIHPIVYTYILDFLTTSDRDMAVESVYFNKEILNILDKVIWIDRDSTIQKHEAPFSKLILKRDSYHVIGNNSNKEALKESIESFLSCFRP